MIQATSSSMAPTVDYSTLQNTHGQHRHVLTLRHHPKRQQQQEQQHDRFSSQLHLQQEQQEKQQLQEICAASSGSESSRLSNRQVTKKAVAFSDTVSVKETPSISTYTDEELEASWYSPQEFKVIRQRIHDVLLTYMYLAGQAPINEGFMRKLCMRGLESSSGESYNVKNRRRRRQQDSILVVQQTMDRSSAADIEIMAYMSHQLSRGAVKEAITRAQMDYEAAGIATI